MLTNNREEEMWRAFRIFLSTVPEDDLLALRGQLDREVMARQECDTNVVRLFLSSLSNDELETARQAIDSECTISLEFIRQPTVRICRPRKPRSKPTRRTTERA